MTEREVVLDIRGLSAGHEGVTVVRGLDLRVAAGEVVALLGPNGAGKTTTLQTVSGLLPIIGGEIDVLGGPPVPRAPHRVARRGVGHVTEDRSLFFDLTARQNLRVVVAGRRREARAVARVLELFPELEPVLDRKAGLLSGGQQQMLALARALIAEPRLLLVDEMSLGLAPIVAQRLLPMVRQVADETGAGVVLVEQHLTMAMAVADAVCLLVHGEVVAQGPASEMKDRRDLFEASYLG
ncbi:MAG: ATP-binding cassette domain-containing protein [Acidimicrobiales bacterium]